MYRAEWSKPMTDGPWFDIENSNILDLCPPDVDEAEWSAFRSRFRASEDLFDNGFPIQIDVELNSGCNMSCPFCIHGYNTIENREMPVEQYKDIIREAYRLGVRCVKLNYINEPLLRKDLEELIHWTRDQGILNVYMVTNGTALTARRRERLLNSGLTKLFVSIDATSSETYDQQRLSGRFERVVENVEAFIRERNMAGRRFPLVLVSFLNNAINQHEREDFKAKWTKIADVVSIQKMNEVPDRDTGLTLDHRTPKHGCKFPFKQLVVDTDGTILPCCKLAGKKMPIGHVSNTSLDEAWRRSEPLRRIHSEDRWQNHPICGPCMRCE